MTKDITTWVSTSGASITMFDDYVIKSGQGKVGQRIDAQADWLQEFATSEYVVPVLSRAPGLVVMPRLQRIVTMSDVYRVQLRIIGALDDVWDRPAKILEPEPYLRDLVYFESQAAEYFGIDVMERMSEMESGIKWGDLPRCRTHGDPTWCNTMLHPNGKLMLIDPIPADERVPDIRAVDLGKLLQSCLGWEIVAHGWRLKFSADAWRWVYIECNDDNEWLATKYWCLIHLTRLVPYFQDREDVVKWASETAQQIVELP